MDLDSNIHPELYQLIGPMEELYQLVPIGWSGTESADDTLLLVPTTHRPSIDNDDYSQYQLVGPVHNDVVLFEEEFYQLAPPNQLDAPLQLLAIEGPPQYQLVGPIPRLARVRCRFANDSHRLVDLVWTDNSNRMYRYAKLGHTEFVDITTFEGHQWVFCDALDGELYLINPGGVKKFVAPNIDQQRGAQLRVSAVTPVNELTLKKIVLRTLATKIFDVWESGGVHYRVMPPMDLLMANLRLPMFIQVQLAKYTLSCILYRLKFEPTRLDSIQQQILNWLVHFIRTNTCDEGN